MVAHEHQGENSHLPSCSPSLTWRLTTNRRASNTSPWWPPRLGTTTSHGQLLEQVCFGTKSKAGFGEVQTTRELPSTRPISSKIFETPHLPNKTSEFKLSTAQVSDGPLLNILFHQSIIPLTADVMQFNEKACSTRKPQAPLTKSLTRRARARYPSHK